MHKPADYNDLTAQHYAAYRPDLHRIILAICLHNKQPYTSGLDVGCGTGQSALALTHFCKQVTGVDPSQAMLEKATPHPAVTYQTCSGTDFDFPDNSFDIIAYAGALFYAKSQQMLDETVRVLKPNGHIVIYDFEILLDETLKALGVVPLTKAQINYDHAVNFSGLSQDQITLQRNKIEKTSIEISSENLAHLLLADKDHYRLLAERLGENELFTKLKKELQQLNSNEDYQITANIFYHVYENIKN